MIRPAEHPTDEQLRAYACGRLPAGVAEAIEPHLESCEECGRKLANAGADTFCDLLRLPATQIQSLPLSQASDAELPAELRNHSRYEIQERLGRGGMGVVYRAVHRMMHRPVALKVIRADLLKSPEAVERFRREVRAAAKLSHANIVAAYDAEEVAGIHYLVMEYVDGQTLDGLVKKRGPLPVTAACHFARQVALGLDHAHSRGMVHRDIKPLNLILADKKTVKILDFGLALLNHPDATNEPSTEESQALGTLLYAAPEQRSNAGAVDARADQYSLGATLAYLLTGNAIAMKRWPESIPIGLQNVLNRLLAKDPADRYLSAKAAADALAPWANPKPIPQPKTFTRRKLLGGGAALLATALGVGAYLRSREPSSVLAPASSSPSPPERADWHSLLPIIDPNRVAVAGSWQRVNGELTVKASRGARIMIPVNPPAEYDLRVQFTRQTGEHSVGIVLRHGGRQVAFEIDAWEQHLAGFQNLNGLALPQQEPKRFIAIRNGQRCEMLVEVRRDFIAGFFQGQEVTRYSTDGRDLSVDDRFWPLPDKSGLGLIAWESDVVFHEVDLQIVGLAK